MTSSGILLIILGILVIAQVARGDALHRLGIG